MNKLDSRYYYNFGTKKIIDDYDKKTKYTVSLGQPHKDNILLINEYPSLSMLIDEDSDGVITSLKNILLTVKTADCVPIIFIDTKQDRIGISHQGYKGTLLKLAQKMVRKMQEEGSKLEDIKVMIGPSICSKCYIVDEERLKKFKNEFTTYIDSYGKGNKGYWIDLRKINYHLIVDMGILPEAIEQYNACTQEDISFYSFRRDKTSKRMVNFIAII